MTIQDYGGNLIKKINFDGIGRQNIAADAYEYYYYQSRIDEKIVIAGLMSCTVYILSMDDESRLRLGGVAPRELSEGDVIQGEGARLVLACENGPVKLLVAGIKGPAAGDQEIKVTSLPDVYNVTKPWGYELWLNGEHPAYAFKKIFIKRGTQTSLQYHEKKRETNVVFSGQARLHYKRNVSVTNDNVTSADMDVCDINPLFAIDVFPPTLHRLEAMTDIVLYETSTPHLDDVIRVSDDSKRGDGRIDGEHRK